VNQRPVRVILDASAIVAYTRESNHVGEVIAEFDAAHEGSLHRSLRGRSDLMVVDASRARNRLLFRPVS
jgi:hypothetical protein